METPRQYNWHQQLKARWCLLWWLKISGITICISAFMVVYVLLQHYPQYPVTVVPMQSVDYWVGLHPWAVWFYVSLWLYIGLAPALSWLDAMMCRYIASVVLLALIGSAIFFFWPTQGPSPGIDWTHWPMLDLLKSADNSHNACPSLHVAFSVLTAVWLHWILKQVAAPRWLHGINVVWCLLIVWSTMAIRQHVALDVETGAVLGLIIALGFIYARPFGTRPDAGQAAEQTTAPTQPGRTVALAAGRWWRRLCTGLCFVLYASISWLGSMTVLPLLLIWPGTAAARQRRIRSVVSLSFRCLLGMIRFFRLGHIDIEGREWLDQAGGKLVIANHPMYLDVLVLISLLPQADCVIKNAMRGNLFYRHFARATGYLSNADGPDLIAEGARRLSAGHTLVLFPEGTRTTPGAPLQFNRGAAQLAARSQCDILPVVIRCEPLALGKGQAWYDVADQPWRLKLEIQPPQKLADLGWRDDIPHSISARRISRGLEAFFTRQLEANHPPATADSTDECVV